MGFVVFFLASWLAGFVIYAMPKRLTLIENTLLFLLVLILEINVAWLIIEEFKYIRTTKDPLLYAGYLLNRSVLIPCIHVIWMNLILAKKSVSYVIPVSFVAAGVILACNGLAVYYRIFTYAAWNAFYDLLLTLSLQIIIYLVYKLFAKRMDSGVRQT